MTYTEIRTASRSYRINRHLESGGQGEIFLLEGDSKVAKVYRDLKSQEIELQRNRLNNMIRMGPPSTAFVWPLEIIEWPSLGYVMEYVTGYVCLGKVSRSEYLPRVDLRTRLRICYRIVEAFEQLHLRQGYAYCDLSDRNVLCDIKSGDVKIIDNDNLWVEGGVGPASVAGTPRCMAPEIESEQVSAPNVETDLHSLAVLIFTVLLFHHPLLGDEVNDDSLMEENALGKGAVYIYHPTNRSNRYTKYDVYGGVSISILPRSLQALFKDAFVGGLHAPYLRVRETNWKKELVNQLDTLVNCSNYQCLGKQSYHRNLPERNTTCVWCDSVISNIHLMKMCRPSDGGILRYKVLNDRDTLAAHHCKLNELFNFNNRSICGRVEHDPDNGLTLRNVSSETFSYYLPNDSTPRPFPPEKRVRLLTGYRIRFGANGVLAEVL